MIPGLYLLFSIMYLKNFFVQVLLLFTYWALSKHAGMYKLIFLSCIPLSCLFLCWSVENVKDHGKINQSDNWVIIAIQTLATVAITETLSDPSRSGSGSCLMHLEYSMP